MKQMNQKIGAGVIWNLLSMFMTRGASTVFTLFLARFIAPEAFGLVAMATVVFEVATVFVTSGLGTALIRSKSVSEADLNTVFYSNILLSIVAYIALYAVAPYIADFYNQNDLITLIRVMGLVVFINAAKVVQTAINSRAMNFKLQMKANTLGVVASGFLAVTAAWQGLGVWSLVLQVLSAAAVSACLLWFSTKWHPNLQFSRESFSRLFGFGKSILAEGILEKLFQNSYILVIGRYFSAEVTGLYFFAKKISNAISQQLTSSVQSASLPALSTLQDSNKELKLKLRQIMQLMLFVVALLMGLLAGFSSLLFDIFFDEKWQAAVPYIQALCGVGVLYPLHSLNINVLNIKGRSDLILKIGILKKTLNLILLFIALPYGVMAIIYSQLLGSLISLVPNSYFSSKLVGYGIFEQISDAFKPISFGVTIAFVGWWVSKNVSVNQYLLLMVSGLFCILLYISLGVLFRDKGAVFLLKKITNHFKLKIN